MKFLSSDAVISNAGMTFGMIACESDRVNANLRDDILIWMLKAMELNTSDMVLQEVLCNAAASLSDDSSKCRLLVEHGGISVILEVLRMFPESSKITYSCLYFLENAAKEDEGMIFTLNVVVKCRLEN